MNNDAHRRLESILDRELEVARRLASTLEAERAALTGSSPAEVTARVAEKVGLLGNFEALESERRGLWDVKLSTASKSVADRWRSLLQIMTDCRKANELNGYIINLRRGHVEQLLNIVRGGTPATYGPQGRTTNKAHRALARA